MMSYQISEGLYALKLKTGYNITQENGQRKTGPPPFWTGPPPPKGCEVFIGKIPRNCFEDELFPVFQKAGIIYDFRLMMDFSSSNRGFAFCTYSNKQDALRAIKMLDGYEIRPGRRIGVLKSLDNCRLVVKGLPTTKSEIDIYEEIAKFTPGINDVIVYTSSSNTLKNQGFALIEYESHRAASQARKILVPGDVKLFNQEINVDWATPQLEDTDDEHLKLVATLFVRNISLNVSESALLNLFSCQGILPVEKVRKIGNVAFVHFFSRHDAEVALTRLNGLNLCGHSIDVTWARPPVIVNVTDQFAKLNTAVYPKSLSGYDFFPSHAQYYEKNLFDYSPVKMLSQMCQANGWGEPVFCIMHTSSSVDELDTFYTAKVHIPNLPCPNKCFEISAFFLSSKEAKNCIAEHALRNVMPLQDCVSQVAYGANSICPSPNMLPYELNIQVPKVDLSNSYSTWSLHQDNQTSSSNESVSQVAYGANPICPSPNMLPFELTTQVPKVDLSNSYSIWSPVRQDNQASSSNKTLNQAPLFSNLLALANIELQSNTKPNPLGRSE